MQGTPPPTRRSLRARTPGETASDRPLGTGTGLADTGATDAVLPSGDLQIDLDLPARDSDSVPARVAAAGIDPDSAAPASAAAAPAASVAVLLPPEAPALAWVDEAVVARGTRPPLQLEAAGAPSFVPVAPDLLARAPRRTPWRPGVLVPIALILTVIAAYCGTTLLWPLHAVAPQVSALAVQPVAAAPATGAWPAAGSAAVSVDGISTPIASAADPLSIASITKVVTALVILDEMPLAVGEQGREFRFTSADRSAYWRYRDAGESALDVPVGGSLTQLQMLQGLLIGSANNYADRLASTIWPTDAVFARAANDWLELHGVPGITIADPSGIDAGNAATPEALLTLAQRALADPVIAEIVRTPAVELPGAGLVENSNPLLADPGVVGIKTGTLDAYNLLAAKDVTVGDTTVRVYAAALGQPDRDTRDAATRALFQQVEQELQPTVAVPQGTVAGTVDTAWGEPVQILTGSDAAVILWNAASASVSSTFSLGDADQAGSTVGSLVATGPKGEATVDLVLGSDVEGPSPFWRLTHPLQLFGLA